MKDQSFIAVSDQELKELPRIPSFVYCEECECRHIVRCMDKIETDDLGIEKRIEDDTLQVVQCDDGVVLLIGINGKKLMDGFRVRRKNGPSSKT